jgi:hypothetical protein
MTITHRMTGTRTLSIYRKMKRRCNDPKEQNFAHYGGRGIKVCDRWMESVENFVADMGLCPDGMTLDRVDSNGNYEPTNCRWATMLTQSRNRTNNIVLEHDGRRMCMSEWAVETGIKIGTLWWRYKAGWDTARILTAKVCR